MALTVGDLVAYLKVDDSDFSSKIGGAEGKFGGFAASAVKYGAAIGTAVVAAGVALYKVGSTFDDVSDTIRVGTGATGEALEGLNQSAKNIGHDVPANFADIGTAVADLNTRLGLTGAPLEDMATQFLNLSRITGTDLKSNIAGLTRMFGDWSIETAKQPAALDAIYRASQATGVGIDSLSASATQFGGPMRQLGFSFEETLAMLGNFEKQGVNTNLVMGSMRIALGKMARAGEDPASTFRRVTEEIKNAGSAGEANAMALELFGAKAGPDMAAAIREGRFELGGLVDQIANGSDTINTAASDTADFAESWQVFKNRALLAIEPIATRVFNALGNGMTWFMEVGVPALQRFGDYLRDTFGPTFESVRAFVERFFSAFSDGEGKASGSMGKLQEAVQKVVDFIGPAMESVRSIFDSVVTIVTALWSTFGDDIVRYWAASFGNIVTVLQGALTFIQGILNVFIGVFTGDWSLAWEGVKGIFSGAWGVITGLLSQALNFIQLVISMFFEVVKALFSAGWDAVTSATSAAWEAIKGATSAAWSAVTGAVGAAWSWITSTTSSAVGAVSGAVQSGWSAVQGATSSAWGAVSGAVSSAWGAITGAISSGVSSATGAVSNGWNSVLTWTRNTWNTITGAVSSAWGQITSAISNGINTAVGWVAGMPGRILSALGNVGSLLADAGRRLIQGFIDGIMAKFNAVKSTLGSLTSALTSWKGPPERDAVLLTDAGETVIDGFIRGLESRYGAVRSTLQGLTNDLSATGTASIGLGLPRAAGVVGAGAGAGAATTAYTINLNMHGVDFNKAQDRRRVVAEVRAGLIALEREGA